MDETTKRKYLEAADVVCLDCAFGPSDCEYCPVWRTVDRIGYEEKNKFQLCCNCAYLGDKFSFPFPNDMVLVDQDNPFVKRFYCCNGDCKWYTKDITGEFIKNCDCFEEL